MNYRHAYHAGNFADVLKHVVLSRVVDYLRRKDTPFRVIDTHAGPGLYDFHAAEAEKTGEWRDGIGRLFGPAAEPLPAPIAERLAPYLAAVAAENSAGTLRFYPGSPGLARRMLRPGDRLVANELHVADHAALEHLFGRDRQTSVLALDGWTAVKSLLPPVERRGVVLIDPPFEQAGEFDRLADALVAAQRRFAGGTVILWYPIKDPGAVERFHRRLLADGSRKLMICDLYVRRPDRDGPLAATGVAICNPPFVLRTDLAAILPFLVERLGQGSGAGFHLRSHPDER